MAFWLRAGLVIGTIYYLSPLRLGEAPAPAGTTHASPMRAIPSLGDIAGPILDALPLSLRSRAVEAAATEAGRGLGTGLRAAVAQMGEPASRDTLTAQDRQPAWRGAAERESR